MKGINCKHRFKTSLIDIMFEIEAFSRKVIIIGVKYSAVEIDAYQGKVIAISVMYDVISTSKKEATELLIKS